MFGSSKAEKQLQHLKQSYLQKAELQLAATHPEAIPDTLMSTFTLGLFKEPVISDQGKVYEKSDIERWLKDHTSDPFRVPLTVKMLHPFPELKKLLNDYQTNLNGFNQLKNKRLSEAMDAVNASVDTIPEVFICPISRQMIKEAVISNTGEVFDRESCPKTALVNLFPEFDHYMNFYRWKVEKDKQQSIRILPQSTTADNLLVRVGQYFTSFFHATPSESSDDTDSAIDSIKKDK